jgi:hypothetical protein
VILSDRALLLNLDDAWPNESIELPVADVRSWGPQLRFSAPPRVVEQFCRERASDLVAPFLLYGSGDFHYLTALRLCFVAEPLLLVAFDNHPDWDVRPPKWACGGWVNRALELPNVMLTSVWGCGNFECWWPHQIFGNRRAERAGILEVHPWADERPLKDQQRKGAILREDWRERFEEFAKRLAGQNVYVTIDLDCLRSEQATTNWRAVRFTVADLEWALGKLREFAVLSVATLRRVFASGIFASKQRFAAEFDRPKLAPPNLEKARATKLATLEKLWPLLTLSL